MKTLLTGLLLASLSLTLTSCGKGGGGGGSSNSTSGLTSAAANLPVVTQQVASSLSTWYNSTVEGTAVTGIVSMQKVQLSSSTSQVQPNCTQKTFLGIPYQYCTSSSSTSTAPQGTVLSTSTLDLISNNTAIINSKGNTN